MKVLIFSHKSDIDGMGGVILAKLAFKEVDYVLCETFNLKEEILKYYKDNKIYEYDTIYVTDMWLEETLLEKIASDPKLKNKFFVFDHHESAKEEKLDRYDFVNIIISDNLGMTSGTSLFYDYLISKGHINNSYSIKRFVQLTRLYDTWEWTQQKEEAANDLSYLFNVLGTDGYINLIYKKLSNDNNNFTFSEMEINLIENKKKQVSEKVTNYIKNIYYKEILGLKAGVIFIDYEYRNDIAMYLRNKNTDLDFVMLIAFQYGVISYRNIKPEIKVRKIAEYFGGKGHDYAASSPIKSNIKDKLIDLLIGRV